MITPCNIPTHASGVVTCPSLARRRSASSARLVACAPASRGESEPTAARDGRSRWTKPPEVSTRALTANGPMKPGA
eukprot:scaffold9772_cov128-Isochrysis_galbana.AAC.4